jgi:zinc protease
VKALALTQLSELHETNYVPANMVLVLSGNYNEKDAEVVRSNFEGKTGGHSISKRAVGVEKQRPKELVIKEKAGLIQSYLSIGARTVPSGHRDSPALNLIGMLLGGGTSSRLFVELRENNALTYDVNASHCKGLDYGYLSVNCAVNTKNLVKTQGLIRREFVKLRTEKVAADELEKAKNMIVGGALRGIDSLEEAPDILTYMEIQFRSEKALVNYLTNVKSTTSEDILRVANVYLQDDCFATAILNPKTTR